MLHADRIALRVLHDRGQVRDRQRGRRARSTATWQGANHLRRRQRRAVFQVAPGDPASAEKVAVVWSENRERALAIEGGDPSEIGRSGDTNHSLSLSWWKTFSATTSTRLRVRAPGADRRPGIRSRAGREARDRFADAVLMVARWTKSWVKPRRGSGPRWRSRMTAARVISSVARKALFASGPVRQFVNGDVIEVLLTVEAHALGEVYGNRERHGAQSARELGSRRAPRPRAPGSPARGGRGSPRDDTQILHEKDDRPPPSTRSSCRAWPLIRLPAPQSRISCSNPNSLDTSNAASTITCRFSSVFTLIFKALLRSARPINDMAGGGDAPDRPSTFNVVILPYLNRTVCVC
ncbi:hypothetical protein OKW42_004643 [Paraburkholderia sp. WC7.3d]